MRRAICRGTVVVRGPEFVRTFGPGAAVDLDAPCEVAPGQVWAQVLGVDVALFDHPTVEADTSRPAAVEAPPTEE